MLSAVVILAVLAQPIESEPGSRYLWRLDEQVEAGFDDLGLLSRSSRIPMADLRRPDAWDRVYRMTAERGDLFARRNGGLTAVFPRSDYVFGRDGEVAVVPADTIYVIGDPPPWLLRQLGLDDGYEELTLPTRLDYSLSAWEPAPVQETEAQSSEVSAEVRKRTSSMWYNDRVRRLRISSRLQEATLRQRR
jgi:hypothetical protein